MKNARRKVSANNPTYLNHSFCNVSKLSVINNVIIGIINATKDINNDTRAIFNQSLFDSNLFFIGLIPLGHVRPDWRELPMNQQLG